MQRGPVCYTTGGGTLLWLSTVHLARSLSATQFVTQSRLNWRTWVAAVYGGVSSYSVYDVHVLWLTMYEAALRQSTVMHDYIVTACCCPIPMQKSFRVR